MPSDEYPRLTFDSPLDERLQFEVRARGYLSNVLVELRNDTRYTVVFYDCARLAQDLEYEVSTGRMCVADVGMIVLPEVTLDNMRAAVKRLAEEGYFDGLKPTDRTRPA